MQENRMLLRLMYFPVEVLGPGRRVGIWFQGCSIGCEGCIAPENRPFDPIFSTTLEDVEDRLRCFLEKNVAIDGVTISGGEPFDQPAALASLVERCRRMGLDDILVYSGYHKDHLLQKYPETTPSLTALVDGPFVRGDLTEAAWKGSANQTLTVFDPLYAEKYALWSAQGKGALQVARDEGEIYLLGIPRQQDVPALLAKMRSALSGNDGR